jgi:hypothetical protein
MCGATTMDDELRAPECFAAVGRPSCRRPPFRMRAKRSRCRTKMTRRGGRRPVDRATAENPASYRVAGFTYKYHGTYGSPPIGRLLCPVQKVEVAADALSVRLGVQCLRDGYIHEIRAAGARAADDGTTVVHDTAYYTAESPAGRSTHDTARSERSGAVRAGDYDFICSVPGHSTAMKGILRVRQP